MPESDPIRERYYTGVERSANATDCLFYAGALLSFMVLAIDRTLHPQLYDWGLLAFVLVVILYFVLGMVTRFYFTPRAEHKRRQDFLTKAFGVSLTHENTVGYYNNDFSRPRDRLAAQVMENSFITKSLALRSAHWERTKTTAYFSIWFAFVLYRRTEFGAILAASQAVFSEQIFSKVIRLEWLRSRCERIYEDLYRLFQSSAPAAKFLPMALDSLLLYETTKSNAGIVLSSKHFDKMNPELTRQWNAIRENLSL
jgi:hypothetical protein